MLRTFIKPMHPEGVRFVAIFAVVALGLALWSDFLGLVGAGLTIWCYYFFRDPERVPPDDPAAILTPADGIVSLIEDAPPPAELGLGDAPRTRVSVFMSVFNCHINRAPAAGEVTAISYHPGKFLNASLDKASEENERNALAMRLDGGGDIAVVQIAGLVARRILCFTKPDAHLAAGERFGLIRFGSRLDVYLPTGVDPIVRVGQTMVAGETVIARR